MNNENNYELEPGEMFLSCQMDIGTALKLAHQAMIDGEDSIRVAAFANESDNDKAPDFRSRQISIWKSKKGENKNKKGL